MSRDAPETKILSLWSRLSSWPFGERIFSLMIKRVVPYSATVGPRVRELEPGHAVVEMRDRRRVRNHLRSIHAVALCNLGEMASGLAMIAAMPASVRGIVTRLEIEFLKKARGTLTARSDARPPERVEGAMDHSVSSEIVDEAGDPVARVTTHWRLAPRQS